MGYLEATASAEARAKAKAKARAKAKAKARAKATAKATAKANAGILRSAQNDKQEPERHARTEMTSKCGNDEHGRE